MSLNEPEKQALGWIEDGLAGSDPTLASMLNIFSRLTSGEEMPLREKIRIRHGRSAAHRPRRDLRHPRRGIALPQARQLYTRLGWQRAMLLLWVIITAALLAVALVLNISGHKVACIPSMGTACPSPPPHTMSGRVHGVVLVVAAYPHLGRVPFISAERGAVEENRSIRS